MIVSPYMIPVRGFLEGLDELADRGVRIKILTGSMGSNNHTVAHSHYKKYRRPILATGAELYEFRHDPSPAIRADADVAPVSAPFISLHVKAFLSDRKLSFIGSLNLDPRAVVINTENGLLIDSPPLAAELAKQMEAMMSPANAWRLYLNDKNELRWESQEGTRTYQPGRSAGQHFSDFFYQFLPIESQL
jgi:putative cardiolipin synthase